ncbi:MAG: hypothetical protein Q4F21_03930 [Lachnospiraceae bacterium]|nr:hypothetical protein [Lachnospiraceae bacterium]
MPGYIIHLAAAKELQPVLEQHKLLRNDDDINAFLVSCLIPDAVSDKTKTHYRQTDDKAIQIRYPQPWRFCDAYPQLIHTPAGIGFLFHLYVDYLFYHEYFSRHVLLTDADHALQVRKEKIELAILLDYNKIVSGKQFFIEKPLYDDYTIINAILEKKYQLSYDFAPVENPGFAEIDYSRIDDIKQNILYYSKLSRQAPSHETHVLKVEPLLEFIRTTAPRFMNDYSDILLNAFSAFTRV